MTTEELIQKCLRKDLDAWDEFVRIYRDVVIRSVRYKLKNLHARIERGEYHDIVQDIFLLIWEKERLSGVKNARSLRSWLAVVSINFTSNYCRDKSVREGKNVLSLDETLSFDAREMKLSEVVSSRGLDTARMLESREVRDILEREIPKLNTRQQLALKFSMYDGKKYKDIARIMNIPLGTVSTLIKRAKEELQRKLKDFRDP